MKFSAIRDALLRADEQALTEWNGNLGGGWHPSTEDRLSFTEHRLQLLAGAFAATLRELIRQEEGRSGG